MSMIASEILAKGVERGIITAEQAERLRALENAGEPPELPASPDDEQLRFIGGFSDIFVTIGLAMFLGAIGYFRAWHPADSLRMWIADRRYGLVARRILHPASGAWRCPASCF